MVTKHANMSGKHRPGQLDANAVDHDIGCGHRVYGSVFDAQASADLFETEVVGGHFGRHAVNADMPAARANRPAGDRGDTGDTGRNASTVSRKVKHNTWFPSNENESYRPYRPKRLKTGPRTGHYYIAGPAQCKADRRRFKPRKPLPSIA